MWFRIEMERIIYIGPAQYSLVPSNFTIKEEDIKTISQPLWKIRIKHSVSYLKIMMRLIEYIRSL